MENDITFFRMICGTNVYIGKTKNFYRLKQLYEKSLERNKFGEPFQTAYLRNGKSVQFEILKKTYATPEQIAENLLQLRDESLQQGYTVMNPTKENPTKGIKRSNATRTRMTEALKKRWEEGGDMRTIHKNMKVSPATRKKISEGVKRHHAGIGKEEKLSRRMKKYYRDKDASNSN